MTVSVADNLPTYYAVSQCTIYKALKIRLTTTPVLCSVTAHTTYGLKLNLNALFHFLLVTEALKCNYNIYEHSFTICTEYITYSVAFYLKRMSFKRLKTTS